MKDYKHYIEKIKKDLGLTNEIIVNADIKILMQEVVSYCRKELKKYYSERKLHELEIARDKIETEIFLIKYEEV